MVQAAYLVEGRSPHSQEARGPSAHADSAVVLVCDLGSPFASLVWDARVLACRVTVVGKGVTGALCDLASWVAVQLGDGARFSEAACVYVSAPSCWSA